MLRVVSKSNTGKIRKNQTQKMKNILPKKIVFTKSYPEDRIKRVTLKRYEKTLKFSTNTFSTKSCFQKTISQ